MFRIIEADTADQVWQGAAKWFLPNGVAVAQTSRSGDTSEVLHAGLSIRDPRQRWIASRSPALNPAFAIAEVIWIVTGRNDSRFLNYFNRSLPRFAGEGAVYHGAYGFRLRRHFGVDQLDDAFNRLKAEPHCRQVVLQIWDLHSDSPSPNGGPREDDIPCNIVALLKVRNNRLEWSQIMRSNDLFRGLPHNIVQFTSLQEVVAGWLGLELGSYNHFSDSLHLYDVDGCSGDRLHPTDVPPNTETLQLTKSESERVFSLLSEFGDLLVCDTTSANTIMRAWEHLDMPTPYLNLAAILACEALRRRGAKEAMHEMRLMCSNECLRFLFDRWVDRMLRH